ncbi:hypothetical protein DSO57_1023810 [Entomophthora muscae]|uniref:Uncharacterized protein n=1 Tax=Entomophthora muscae TaxID=34485 RepID=A0ACC2UBS5_9FUNG|nr:hypothetical protein DSO57_1023810 [Entomophthora muscae]
MSEVINNCLGFLLVAVCWGLTNPFIKSGSRGVTEVKASRPGWVHQTLAEYKYLFSQWKYVLPLLLNLSGSMVYYYTLGNSEISLAVPITNSLSLLFTLLGGFLFNEKVQNKETYLGMILVIIGVTLCVYSKAS